MTSPGVTVRPIITMDGEHEVNEVWFDNVEVPADQLIGEENKGWTYAKHLLAHERTNIADVNRAKRELERLKRVAKDEGVWDDVRFRDQIALLEVDVVALEMMVLRVLSAETCGKQSLDVAGLLKIRGSEIQQRYTELMMLAAGPAAVPLISRRWKPAGRATRSVPALRRAAGRPPTSTCARRRSTAARTRSSATSSRRPSWGADMDFDFSDDQEMLRDTVRRWVGKDYGFESRRAWPRPAASRARPGRAGRSRPEGLAVPEAHGGMGFGPVEAMVVMEELGRGLVMEPFARAPWWRRGCSAPAGAAGGRWLGRIADGEAIVVLAHEERAARYRLGHVETSAARSGGGWPLRGNKIVVPAAAQADAFIVPARVVGAADDAAGVGLFLVAREARHRRRGLPDAGRRGAPPSSSSTGARRGADRRPAMPSALEHAVDVGIAALCAEAVGAMDGLVAMTVEYMNTRKQFGVPIATFQALRHRMADVKMQLELARSMSYFASLKLGEEPAARRRALSQAKVQLGQSMRFVGQQCIQLHGGIGVTDEYAASHYFKRLTVIEMTFGDTLHHLGEVSSRMQDTAGVFA